jgi:hypothetical protein
MIDPSARRERHYAYNPNGKTLAERSGAAVAKPRVREETAAR